MWFLVRLFVELTAGMVGLSKAFIDCPTVHAGVSKFTAFDDLQRAGVLLFVLLVLDGLYRIWEATHNYFHPHRKKKSKKPTE